MGLIKKPAEVTKDAPSLPASSVTEPMAEEQPKVEETKTEPTKKASKVHKRELKDDKPEINWTQMVIVAQNACGNVITSQEWANVAIACKDEAERNEKFEKAVRNYMELVFKLAEGK